MITEETKWELTRVAKVKVESTNNLESTMKLANRNIMENRKIIAQLEKNLSDMAEELAALKYKKRQTEEDLEIKIKSYKEAVKTFKEKEKKFMHERQKAEDKITAMHELIDLEQRMQAIIVRKIDILEKNFAKSEAFLLTLDNFLGSMKQRVNSSVHNSGTGEVDLAFLES